MKYFNGYYKQHIDAEMVKCLEGEYHVINERNKWGIPRYSYHLVDCEFISGYFNRMDDEKIRNVCSIDRFERNEFQAIWKSKPNYGVCFN